MNNSKHTKGPWHFIETGPIRKGGPKASLLANPSPHIHGVCEGVSDADARLIAAAPELLETLKLTLSALQSLLADKLPNVTHEDTRLIKAIESAIAKATGGSNE